MFNLQAGKIPRARSLTLHSSLPTMKTNLQHPLTLPHHLRSPPMRPHTLTWHHSNSNHFSLLLALQWQDSRARPAFSSLWRAGLGVRVNPLSSVHPVGCDYSRTSAFQIVSFVLHFPEFLLTYLTLFHRISCTSHTFSIMSEFFSGAPVCRDCRWQRRHPTTDSPSLR